MNNKTKIIIFSIFVGIVLLVILLNYVFSEVVSVHGNLVKRVYVRDVLVKAEVVDTDEKIQRGLAGRKNLPEGRGMLFQMPEDNIQRFWMKGMVFPIDIIWIEDSHVTGCEKNIQPSDSRIFASPSHAGYVLEVPEGFCDRYGVEVNDEVRM
jgi:uncharacterized membrane protein (UPF0127 family)